MLLLRRQRGESIQIGTDVVVTVVSLDDGTVLLGFSAPRNVPILRMELEDDKRAGLVATCARQAGEGS
jgi:carbon storage regulator